MHWIIEHLHTYEWLQFKYCHILNSYALSSVLVVR